MAIRSAPSAGGSRADAVRNRRLLLNAAAEAFAEHGAEVSVAEIARRAGIGKGTVFRHFTTKDDLLTAIIVDTFEQYTAAGRELLEALDPAAALLEFMAAGNEYQMRNRAMAEAYQGMDRAVPEVRAAMERLFAVTEELTGRARGAGAIRDDVTGQDIALLLCAPAHIAAPMRSTNPDLWRRYLGLIFDGLRPDGAHPLPPGGRAAPPYGTAPAGADACERT